MPTPKTLRSLPDTYQEALYFRLTEATILLWMNILALGLIVVWGVLFLGILLLYHAFLDAPLLIEPLPQSLPPLLIIVVLISTFLLHEWAHGLAIRWFGHRPRYGFKPLKGVLYATADGAYFWRNQFIAVALAPLVGLSVVYLAGMLWVSPEVGVVLMLAATLNATGAIGDIWSVVVVIRYPPTAIVQDLEDALRVFTEAPSGLDGLSSVPTLDD